MRAGIDGVYAAGDCVECRHFVSKKPVWQPLGDVANRQARVAGINVAGGNAQFPGVLGSAIFRTFDLAVARTGLSFNQARESGFDPKRIAVQAPSRARYMPQSRPIDLILTDRPSGRAYPRGRSDRDRRRRQMHRHSGDRNLGGPFSRYGRRDGLGLCATLFAGNVARSCRR